jgi:hypothetical protein
MYNYPNFCTYRFIFYNFLMFYARCRDTKTDMLVLVHFCVCYSKHVGFFCAVYTIFRRVPKIAKS